MRQGRRDFTLIGSDRGKPGGHWHGANELEAVLSDDGADEVDEERNFSEAED